MKFAKIILGARKRQGGKDAELWIVISAFVISYRIGRTYLVWAESYNPDPVNTVYFVVFIAYEAKALYLNSANRRLQALGAKNKFIEGSDIKVDFLFLNITCERLTSLGKRLSYKPTAVYSTD